MTIYRKNAGQVERFVCHNCRFEVEVESKNTILGDGQKRKCFLAVPGEVTLSPGDRVVPGIGPEGQIPAEAVELTYAKPFFLGGQRHHTEAGTE